MPAQPPCLSKLNPNWYMTSTDSNATIRVNVHRSTRGGRVTGWPPDMAQLVPDMAFWPGNPWQGSLVLRGRLGGGSLWLGGAGTVTAHMDVLALGKLGLVVIEVTADLVTRGRALCGQGQERGGVTHIGGRNPAHVGNVGVLGADCGGVILTQAVLAPWDGLHLSREGLIAQPGV